MAIINLINPFPIDSSKLKEFADKNFKFDENGRTFSKLIENAVGKGEIARYEQFLLLKLKEFADKNFKFDENGRKFSKLVKNAVGKGEIARYEQFLVTLHHYEQFLLFPHCF